MTAGPIDHATREEPAAARPAPELVPAPIDAAPPAPRKTDTPTRSGLRLAELSALDPHELALLATLGC